MSRRRTIDPSLTSSAIVIDGREVRLAMTPSHKSDARSAISAIGQTIIRAPVVLAALALAACSSTGDLPLLGQADAGAYTLGAGDELRLIVYGEPQLTGRFFVSDQGVISVPLLGDVRAAGLTRGQLDREIADGLKQRKLLVNPSVSVDVVQYRPVYILGEVEKPGAYPYQPGLTMLSAVALAGGFTYRGVKSVASVVRTRNGQAIQGRVMPRNFLEPGDVLTIDERFF